MFPVVRFFVCLVPRDLQYVGEEPFGQAVTPHQWSGDLPATRGESDATPIDLDQALFLEPSHLLRDG